MALLELKWDKHERSMCKGLTSLQQNGEFVDMTIAADGCFVKVHQIVMSLASPYIKKLILSAPTANPVLFLNNVTAATLCGILEYIYTGEVIVKIDHVKELFEAGKNLQIMGLEDLRLATTKEISNSATGDCNNDISNENECDQIAETDSLEHDYIEDPVSDNSSNKNDKLPDIITRDESLEAECNDEEVDKCIKNKHIITRDESLEAECNDEEVDKCIKNKRDSSIQYTVSNQGSLQLILNRYIYYLKYSNKKNNTRQWRCINYTMKHSRCPAYIITSDNMVVQRLNTHTHSYHDKQVLKKCRLGQIFSTTTSAEKKRHNIKKSK